jgi:hypothetical protein
MSINYSIPKKYKNQKQKNVFAFSGFRGLDKENKPVKVQPFRATDGHNFILDSDTLKTRPSYKLEIEPTFVVKELEPSDYLIDWYQFGTMRVYVTKFHFYFEQDGASFNEQTAQSSTFTKGGIAASYDFSANKPHFQEEKECLFIFCLNGIFVVSKIDTRIVFYELNSKPTNPYDVTNVEAFEAFHDLPIPYEPTVSLDEKPFDDVNLLSGVSKYRLFAASKNTHNGETTYTLPTTFNSTKNSSYAVDISFYKDRYGKIPEVFPVFMGVEKDNFPAQVTKIVNNVSTQVDTQTTFGDPLIAFGSDNDNTADETPDDVVPFAEIRDIYYPPIEFTYFGNSGHTQHSPISEKYGLNKDNFFSMVVKNTDNITVFQYLMDYISNNKVTFDGFTTNKWIAFKLIARVNATFYDNNSSVIKEKAVLEKTVLVYVQLRKYEENIIQFSGTPAYLQNTSVNPVEVYSTAFATPAFPTTTSADHTFYIAKLSASNDSFPSEIPTQLNQNEVEAFIRDKANTLLLEKTTTPGNNISNNQTVRIFGKFFQTFEQTATTRSVTLPTAGTSNFKFAIAPGQNTTTPPSYPAMPIGFSADFTLNLGFVGNGSRINFSASSDERSALISGIRNHSSITSLTTPGTYTFDVQATGYKSTSLPDPNDPSQTITTYTAFAVRVVATITVTASETTQHRRYAISVRGTVAAGQALVKDVLYHFDLKEEENEIRFRVKDYFYDFNNEPTIDIRLVFQGNPDYQIIAHSKFSVNFGSENRLFLAGNTEYPNIDRFNVSNNLLGDGEKNQSYELTYFPSKNYRVLGGKGAINGYVVATDSELYITKQEYPNDDRFFIRQRLLNESGIVGYNEFKTNIQRTPINNRCIVRFYNDILILSKEGLYGVEISSNVLTNERLLKLRSGFINDELTAKINAIQDKSKIFVVEDNRRMYIFIGKEVYLADSRYIAQNPNSEIENLSYEIVKWTSEVEWFTGKAQDGKFYLIDEVGDVVYSFGEENYDEYIKKEASFTTSQGLTGHTDNIVFTINSTYNYIFASASTASNYAFVLQNGYKVVGDSSEDYTESNGTVTVVDVNAFAPFTDGSKLYWETTQGGGFEVTEFTVAGFEASNRTTFTYGATAGYKQGKIYQNIAGLKLYITHFWQIGGVYQFRLAVYRPTSATLVTQNQGETDTAFRTRLAGLFNEDEDYYFVSGGAVNTLIAHVPYINTRWVSSISDFGNNLFEKTSFRVNIYATKQPSSNNMTFGYRTLRRLAGLSAPVDLSNEFNLQDIAFSQFSLATMDTVGFSLPMKENNFLYIQFTINGTGKIELNAIEITYKLNRMLKSVG